LKQKYKQIEGTSAQNRRFPVGRSVLVAGPNNQWRTTMIRIAALAVAAALMSLPMGAHAQGKSGTAPGRTTDPARQAPGHTTDPNANAPGQLKPPGESAKELAPGRDQSAVPNPNASNAKKK
jgi:hypothetical protein